MAVFGMGAIFNGAEDHVQDFIERNIASMGWGAADAPYFHEILRLISIGDIIYLKSYSPTGGLTIKAVGMVTRAVHIAHLSADDDEGRASVGVRWIHRADEKVGAVGDRADFMRRGSLYQEHNPDVQRLVQKLLFKHFVTSD